MKVLFIHQNFPGQFRHIAAHLAKKPDVQVLAIGREQAPGLPGVRNAALQTSSHGQAPIKLQICGLFDVELFGFSETMKAVVRRVILHFALLRGCAGTAVA